jgi:predicted nucleotidyltransferase
MGSEEKMQVQAEARLNEIEKKEQVRILLAVEAGSCAWGLATADADSSCQVRFIYAHPAKDYLKLNPPRDVLAGKRKDIMDIRGWDLRKALRLLRSSNPTFFEWNHSPIRFREDQRWKALRPQFEACFRSRPAAMHYLHMAEGQLKDLHGKEGLVKKVLYTLRAVLACMYILDKRQAPPAAFIDLMKEELDPSLRPSVEDLVYREKASSKSTTMALPEEGMKKIDQTMDQLRKRTQELPAEAEEDWDTMNAIFYQLMGL